jgi:uncharacterized protein YggE
MRMSLLSVLLSVAAAPIWAEEAPARLISTSGESVVYVTPDEVIVNVGVETFNSDLDKVKNENDEHSSRLLKAIKALGVEEKHIQTDTLDLEIQYKDSAHATHGIEGYFAHRQYSVTLKDTKLFEKLIDTALRNGANRLMGFEFKTSELRKHRDTARSMAIKAAKEKAIELARDLDMKVGKPRTIGEAGIGYYGGRSYFGWAGNAMQNSAQVAPGGAVKEGRRCHSGRSRSART